MTPLCMTTNEGVAISDCNEHQKNILIVDDDQYLLFSMVKHLRTIGTSLNIYTAANGKQARSILSTIPVNLVISDVKMPVMDGMELALWLSEARPQIPAIMMSGCADPESVASIIQKGYSFIEKPVNQKKLFEVVQTLVTDPSATGVKLPSRSSAA